MIDKSTFSWPGDRHGAVSITYDDAVSAHHESVAPAWEKHGLNATFYTPINSLFTSEVEAWRTVAAAAHTVAHAA